MSNTKKRNKRSPPDVAAQLFSRFNDASTKKDRDPPCSPEEVKALMGMFAEIMGMSEKKSSVSFMFGSKDREWPPSALAAAAKAASMYLPPEDFVDYDDDDDDHDDDEEEDDDEENDDDDDDEEEETKRPAIDPSEWKDLEQVARDEKREEEKKEMKAAKKREKKQRKKERLRKEASVKAAESALKKQEKLATSWKSRVAAACQLHDVTKLQGLLGESPFKKEVESMDYIEYLLQLCVAKANDTVESGVDCRLKVTDFIHNNSPLAFFAISAKTGRSSFHAACFVGDFYFVQFVLEHNDASDDEDDMDSTNLNSTCEESGLAPLHYAVLSGSAKVIKALLQYGCKVDALTCEKLTSCDGKGLTALELAQLLLEGKHDTITSDGSALSDAVAHFISDSDREREFKDFWRYAISEIHNVIENGNTYSIRKKKDDATENQEALKPLNKAKKKKKKKKQQQSVEQNAAPAFAATVQYEDPMIEALLGMGFTNQQIEDAAAACGGTDRATADDLVMWIFAQEAGDAPPEQPPEDTIPVSNVDKSASDDKTKAEAEQLDALRKAEEARLAKQRLAQKREEQRRRNREWNNREQLRQAQERMLANQAISVSTPQELDVRTDSMFELEGTLQSQFGIARAYPSEGTHIRSDQARQVATSDRQTAQIKILSRSNASSECYAESNISSIKKHPPGMETIGADLSRVGSSGIAEDATVSSLGSGVIGQNDWMNENDYVDTPVLAGYHGISCTAPTPFGFQFRDINHQSPENIYFEKTSIDSQNNPNPLGVIRASARAFVPTSFKPPPGLSTSNVGLPTSSHVHSVATEMPFISGLEHRANTSAMPTLLPEALTSPFDQLHDKAPVLNDFSHLLTGPSTSSLYSNVPSATSSVTGYSNSDDVLVPPGIGVPSSLGLGNWELRNAAQASHHDPLSLSLTHPEPSSLWSEVSSIPQIAGAPLGGFSTLAETMPSLAVYGGAFVPNSSEQDDNKSASNRGGWGTTTSSSIW